MDVIGWLLEGDPSIRWQVMRDLLAESPESIAGERARVAEIGWGRALLDAQEPDGQWGGGFYGPKWVSTTYTLLQLRHLGVNSEHLAMRKAVNRLVGGGATWRAGSSLGNAGSGFFEYLGETCVTAMNLALASYFDVVTDRTREVVVWLLGEQMDDGGWNCESTRGSTRSSFHTTISTLEGLLEFEHRCPTSELVESSQTARSRAHEYLLDRHLFRSLSTGALINESWTRFSFPPRWWFDVLRGLDYLVDARVAPDERWSEALALLDKKRTKDGQWRLQNHHSGREHFRMEEPGKPSRWNTLRALRVLRRVEGG